MADIHLSAVLIAGPSGANPISAAAAGPTDGSDAFSAVLAGELATTALAAPAKADPGAAAAAGTLSVLDAGTEPAPSALLAAIQDLPLQAAATPAIATGNALVAGDPADQPPHADPDAAEQPPAAQADPDGAIQLLLAMGVLQAQPAARQIQAGTASTIATTADTAPGIAATFETGTSSGVTAARQGTRAAQAVATQPNALPAQGVVAQGVVAPSVEAADFAPMPARAALAGSKPDLKADLPAAFAPVATVHAIAAAPAALQVAAPAAAPDAAQLAIPGPLGSPHWREAFATGVSMLANRGVSLAELQVQPADLGPIRVSIRIEGGEASIICAAQHPETRHALDASLPRLREMLEASGISVGNTSVGPQFAGGGAANPQANGESRGYGPPLAAPDAPPPAAAPAAARANQLVDVFA